MIKTFDGGFRFLSNFHPSIIQLPLGGRNFTWSTAEHLYQACKTSNLQEIVNINTVATPGRAKRAGRKVTLRPRWDDLKFDVMKMVVFQKFFQNPELAEMIISTNYQQLIEGNRWHDNFWGSCTCEKCQLRGGGENRLGQILMGIRLVMRDWYYGS